VNLPTLRTIVALGMIVILASCGGGDGTSVDDALASVSVSPGTAMIVSLGDTQQLSATARTSGGSTLPASFTWSSSDEAVATVSGSGVVTAVSNGSATITASTGGVSGTATVTVLQQAASVVVTLAADTITSGNSTQASATVEDTNGNALSSLSLAWSSSDESIATVDGSGLVSGSGDGDVAISASVDGVVGSSTLTVLRQDLTVEEDTQLSGSLSVASMSVSDGVTVTLVGDVTIDASGPVTIAGTIQGDCAQVEIESDAAVTVSGEVSNTCTVPGGSADLTIRGTDGVDLGGAVLESSGDIVIELLEDGAAGGPAQASSSFNAHVVNLVGTSFTNFGPATKGADGTAEGGRGTDGKGLTLNISADGAVAFGNTTIRTQPGGDGGDVSNTASSDVSAVGGRGGDGGHVVVNFAAAILWKTVTPNPIGSMELGAGGDGGSATALGTQNASGEKAPSATATGGDGGSGGRFIVNDSNQFAPQWASSGGTVDAMTITMGVEGRGGEAEATGADGVDATSDRSAQAGGDATGTAGSPGALGPIPPAGLFDGLFDFSLVRGPDPVFGIGVAGDGGNGANPFPNGAGGGSAVGNGSRGADSWGASGRPSGSATARGGNGGDGADVCRALQETSLAGVISVLSDPASSDQFIFNAGSGIDLSFLARLLQGLAGAGGSGGDGGALTPTVNAGGANLKPGGTGGLGSAGLAVIGSGGNGGDGGAGATPGPGGMGGALLTVSDPKVENTPRGQDGQAGGACPGFVSAAGFSATIGASNGLAARDIQFTGSGAWVTVTGTIEDDGTVTAAGRGTVAGVSDILVEFSGTYDEGTGALDATYTIDSEKVISAGHPVVYQVTVTGG
jgi:uncharacterized protein YjdB